MPKGLSMEEEPLVVALETCGWIGWPVGNGNIPGKDWCIAFWKRKSEQFQMKKPEVLAKARGKNSSTKNLR